MTDAEKDTDGASPGSYVIITQCKSNRVVYFTDDPDYQSPMNGDWYYVSGYAGDLPPAMTLRNCWRWRFNGGVFTDARDPPAENRAEALLEANRKALRRILNEKIDQIRRPFRPSCSLGAEMRLMKLEQARAFVAAEAATGEDGGRAGAYDLLEMVAVASRISLRAAAELIIAKDAEMRIVLRETERFREMLARAIDMARSQAELIELRSTLLDDIYPELSGQFRYALTRTEPVNTEKALPKVHVEHEKARLRAQLRELVNLRRKELESEYIRNDDLRRHKLRLSQIVLANVAAGRAPAAQSPGLAVDFGLLEQIAEARGLSLAEVAEAIAGSARRDDALLEATERFRDEMLARIDAVATLADLAAIDARLGAAATEPALPPRIEAPAPTGP